MTIIEVGASETVDEAVARVEREGRALIDRAEQRAAEAVHRGAEALAQVEQAQAVETPEEIARLAADPSGANVYQDEEDPSVSSVGWRIDSVHSLDWALSRMADLEREQAENEEIVGQQIDRLRARLEELNERAERGLKFFRSQVTAYAKEHRAELLGGGKKKSRTLPSGVIGWKKVPAQAVLTDEKALLEWARQQPVEAELVRITEKPAWSAIKKQIEESGEVLPGTDYQPEGEALTIKTEAK